MAVLTSDEGSRRLDEAGDRNDCVVVPTASGEKHRRQWSARSSGADVAWPNVGQNSA